MEDKRLNFALHHAVVRDSLEDIGKLLDAGVDINIEDCEENFHWGSTNNHFTPLMVAVSKNNLKSISLLIDRGADINFQCRGITKTALGLAISNGYLGVTQYLLENGANLSIVKNCMDKACNAGKDYDSVGFIKLLVEYGADMDEQDYLGHSPLMKACFRGGGGNIEAVKALLELGANRFLTAHEGKKDLPVEEWIGIFDYYNYKTNPELKGLIDHYQDSFFESQKLDSMIDRSLDGVMGVDF